MSNPNWPNPLDRLLCQWAEEQSPAAADLNLLSARIVQAIEDEPESPGEFLVVERSSVSRFGPAAWFALGAAAAVLLAFGFMWLADGTNEETSRIAQTPDLPPPYVWLRDEQLRNKAVLLNEMESTLGRKLNWLAETADNVQIDIERQSSAGVGQPLAVRIVVERRPVGQPNWTVAWAIDVVTRSEEVVLLRPTANGDPQFEMWTYALPDGMIALDTGLNLSETIALRSTSSEVQSDREPREIFTTQADGFEFRVFQTVAVLNHRLS